MDNDEIADFSIDVVDTLIDDGVIYSLASKDAYEILYNKLHEYFNQVK